MYASQIHSHIKGPQAPVLSRNYIDFEAKFVPNGYFDITTAAGDGNCFVNCISILHGRGQEDAAPLRAAVVNHLQENSALYEPFYDNDGEDSYHQPTFARYLVKLAEDGIYFGELGIRAMEDLLNRPIAIWYEDKEGGVRGLRRVVTTFGSDEMEAYYKKVPPLHLLRVGQIHYDVINWGRKIEYFEAQGYGSLQTLRSALLGPVDSIAPSVEPVAPSAKLGDHVIPEPPANYTWETVAARILKIIGLNKDKRNFSSLFIYLLNRDSIHSTENLDAILGPTTTKFKLWKDEWEDSWGSSVTVKASSITKRLDEISGAYGALITQQIHSDIAAYLLYLSAIILGSDFGPGPMTRVVLSPGEVAYIRSSAEFKDLPEQVSEFVELVFAVFLSVYDHE